MSRRISILTITAVLVGCALTGSAGAAPGTQDLRSPDTRDAVEQMEARDLGVTPSQDLRSPDARDAAREFPAYPTPPPFPPRRRSRRSLPPRKPASTGATPASARR